VKLLPALLRNADGCFLYSCTANGLLLDLLLLKMLGCDVWLLLLRHGAAPTAPLAWGGPG
jgi:hypothetical protein